MNFLVVLSFIILCSNGASGSSSFEQDILQFNKKKSQPVLNARLQFDFTGRTTNKKNEAQINAELLKVAIPVEEYESKYNVIISSDESNQQEQEQPFFAKQHQQQQQQQQQQKRQLQEEDDFYLSDDEMYSFTSYSLKYAKCQPVQYFSEDAIAAGEHSPMVTQDIVLLRLCPQSSCTTSAMYGCHYNYADYAISLSNYLIIMLKYSGKQLEQTCDYCQQCQKYVEENGGEGGGEERRKKRKQRRRQMMNKNERILEDANGADEDGAVEGDDKAVDDGAVEEEENQAYQAAEEDDYYGYEGDDYASYEVYCPSYKSYCSNYDNDCDPENADDAYVGYMDYDEIIDAGYMNCVEAKYNNYAYFVRPRCNAYDGTIKMAVFYDQFCVQYAGSDVSIKDMGLGFRENIFEPYYNSSVCIDCNVDDESVPPYFSTNGALCNKIHYTSAKCTKSLTYDVFDGFEDSSSECTYIESLRYGTYDENGKLSTSTLSSGSMSWSEKEISDDQKIMLTVSVIVCILLILYACYVHHQMTNLLIKSLSHRELLPPSRHKYTTRPGVGVGRRGGTTNNNNSSSVRGGSSSRNYPGRSNHDDDWDKPQIV